jgi:phage shock protein PspC (stress-responsive transcriptional regulator)
MSLSRGSSLRRGADHVIGGVCSGLADYFRVDPLFVRLAFVALAFAGGAGILLYLVLWVLMPAAGSATTDARTLARENVRGMADEFRQMGDEFRRMGEEFRQTFRREPGTASGGGSSAPGESVPPGGSMPPTEAATGSEPGAVAAPPGPVTPPPSGGEVPPHIERRRGLWLGGILVVLGGIFLLSNLGYLNWWNWRVAWPMILILIGILVLVQRMR